MNPLLAGEKAKGIARKASTPMSLKLKYFACLVSFILKWPYLSGNSGTMAFNRLILSQNM
jgi:hypothetical protein